MVSKKKINKLEKELGMSFEGIEVNVEKRWERGIPHHPKSKKLVEAMALLDFEIGGNCLDIRIGGDGDNGEAMMYLLDIYFETENKK